MDNDTQLKISQVCENLEKLLLTKNKNYGDSALSPVKIFNKTDVNNSILIRLDDKINRIINSRELRRNDVADIIGYLLLYCVSQDWLDFSDLVD